MIQPSLLLRGALQLDAAASAAMALALSLGAAPLAALLHLPHALLFEAGLFLVAYAAFVGWLATRTALSRALVLVVIAGNALWMLGSVALIVSGGVSPNGLGTAFVLAQGIAVGIFAELQFIGLKRSAGLSPA